MANLTREFVQAIIKPLVRRSGTALAAYLIAKGAPQDAAEQLAVAVGVVVGLTADLIVAYVHERRLSDKVTKEAEVKINGTAG